MMKIIQYRNDSAKAVVIAKDVNDGYYRLKLHAPREDWSKAEYFTICYTHNTLTPRVLAIEKLDELEQAVAMNKLAVRVMVRAFLELNTIRARDGVHYTHQGIRSSV